MKELDSAEKIVLINYILDIIFKNDKLKHSVPPIKKLHLKKQNAKRYNFKEKSQGEGEYMDEDSAIQMRLKEMELKKRGILISESTHKRKVL